MYDDVGSRTNQRDQRSVVLVVDDSAMDRHLAASIVETDPTMRAEKAANGLEALGAAMRCPPAAVVTDLQMPEMDGLELVDALRNECPQVPVILMTANGSEDIALKALRHGAASYVPKRLLARELIWTLRQVLEAAKTDQRHTRFLDSLERFDCHFALESDPELVPPVVAHLQDTIARLGVSDRTQRTRVGIALEEALLNGMYHGNLELPSALKEDDDKAFEQLGLERRRKEPFAARRLHLRVQASRTEARFVVRDEGPGFDPYAIPDPTAPENLEKASGRGLLLIRSFMESATHNGQGNEITMVARWREATAPSATSIGQVERREEFESLGPLIAT